MQIELLTKGDYSAVNDRVLYAPGQRWLQREEIVGRVRGSVGGCVGFIGIIVSNQPRAACILIGNCSFKFVVIIDDCVSVTKYYSLF